MTATSAEKSSHTPAPWEQDGREIIRRPFADSGLKVIIAKVAGSDNEESEANARLIAAAPDLLAALKLCLARDPSLQFNAMVSEALAKASRP